MSTKAEDRSGLTGREPALPLLLDRAIGGDEEALSGLLALLSSTYGRRIVGSLRRLRKQAHTQTLEDVVQESLIELVRRIKAGELTDLPAGEQEALVKYFQRLCDGRLLNALEARKSPVLARNKPEVPETLLDERAVIPGAVDETPSQRHRAMLAGAMGRLDPTERVILERFMNGESYGDISKDLGRDEGGLRKLAHFAKRKLLLDIASESPTAKAQLRKLKEARDRVPSLDELRKAIGTLPVELRQAVSLVHLDGGTLDQLARELGDRGCEKAQARLKTAYRSLSGKLRLPFPETFEKIAR